MRVVTLIFAVAAVAGCSGQVSGGGSGLDQTVMKVATGDIVPPARDFTGMAVRSFVVGADAVWQEIEGARCEAAAGPFRAVLVTPGQLVVADLGPDAPNVTVRCTDGVRSGSNTVVPVFDWPVEDRPNALSRISYGGGWWYGYRKSGPLGYPDVSVGMQ